MRSALPHGVKRSITQHRLVSHDARHLLKSQSNQRYLQRGGLQATLDPSTSAIPVSMAVCKLRRNTLAAVVVLAASTGQASASHDAHSAPGRTEPQGAADLSKVARAEPADPLTPSKASQPSPCTPPRAATVDDNQAPAMLVGTEEAPTAAAGWTKATTSTAAAQSADPSKAGPLQEKFYPPESTLSAARQQQKQLVQLIKATQGPQELCDLVDEHGSSMDCISVTVVVVQACRIWQQAAGGLAAAARGPAAAPEAAEAGLSSSPWASSRNADPLAAASAGGASNSALCEQTGLSGRMDVEDTAAGIAAVAGKPVSVGNNSNGNRSSAGESSSRRAADAEKPQSGYRTPANGAERLGSLGSRSYTLFELDRSDRTSTASTSGYSESSSSSSSSRTTSFTRQGHDQASSNIPLDSSCGSTSSRLEISPGSGRTSSRTNSSSRTAPVQDFWIRDSSQSVKQSSSSVSSSSRGSSNRVGDEVRAFPVRALLLGCIRSLLLSKLHLLDGAGLVNILHKLAVMGCKEEEELIYELVRGSRKWC